MAEQRAVVYGAGKISRGFLGNLLADAGFAMTFVDVDARIVGLLADRKQYHIHILGAPEKDSLVTNVTAVTADDAATRTLLVEAAVAFVSVGGANLASVAKTIAPALCNRFVSTREPLNIVVCENWRAAAATLRDAIALELADDDRRIFDEVIGIAESTILRSGIAGTKKQLEADPLAVQAQDYWDLPVDGDALVGGLPEIPGVSPIAGFSTALERKMYTYNCGNALISYLGWLRGHELLSQAANDAVLADLIDEVYKETCETMVKRHGYDRDDQRDYAMRSLAKFRDETIVDPLYRQTADPIRKLGREDRLVGAGLAALDEGVSADAIAVGIAAALRHRNPADPSAVRLAELIDERGEGGALASITGLAEDHPLVVLALAKLPEVDALAKA
ncbi:hypothetical protein [Demequina lutea]|uniref:Mannitol-1-phosphate 5-dehydrogenase n=1 Tax=Demequina lutea TaxID=431489 RepID=A0A7Y9Z8E3_9MICO|nr:hypothetical protein [Demequina lutea]NYI40506.1 mannitol-1-phosphate 5-dehydrogenase [Demequina lutea]